MRVTGPLLKVLAAFVAEPGEEQYGLDLLRRTGLKSGTLYPLLDRLVAASWIVGRWESEATGSGPRRRFYRLTAIGAHEARQVLFEYGTSGGLAWA